MQDIYLQLTINNKTKYAIVESHNTTILKSGEDSIANISTQQVDRIIVLVPNEDVVVTTVDLPLTKRAHIQKAASYALEDKLLDEIENLHFALGKAKDSTYPVAIVAKKKMTEWLACLDEFKIKPSYLISDAYTSSDIVETENQPIQEITFEDRVASAAKNVRSNEAINLLQSPYYSKQACKKTKELWSTNFKMLLSIVGILFITQILSMMLLFYKEKSIQHRISAIYYLNLDKTSTPEFNKKALADKLKNLNQLSQNHFLILLAKVATAMKNMHGLKIHSLDYQNTQLTLDVSGATYKNISEFMNNLRDAHLSVTELNTHAVSTQMRTTLVVNH